eukprot:scaffold12.g8053.t1
MPLRLDIKRVFSQRSDRVKGVDLHPTEPWILACLYNGHIYIWNYAEQSLVKSFEVTELPVRTAKFITRKQWFVCGADDMMVRVYNYNTMDKVKQFEAHTDYIRSVAVHPTLPYLLTCSDDMLIKLWDWDKGWACTQIFEGHSHYVMQARAESARARVMTGAFVVRWWSVRAAARASTWAAAGGEVAFNPKDTNTFASASLDRSVKVWSLGSPVPNFTLEGHEKGVNCVDYYSGGDRPYLVTGADDRLIKVWDYQTKACIQTLEGHRRARQSCRCARLVCWSAAWAAAGGHNISTVCFHPELPLILTGSEDGTVKLWHSTTYRRARARARGQVAPDAPPPPPPPIFDEGAVMVMLGREEPVASMDASGKIIWARHNEIQTTNVKALGDVEETDGERLPLAVKDLGSSDLYPQSLAHSPNGRFVTASGQAPRRAAHRRTPRRAADARAAPRRAAAPCPVQCHKVCGDGEYVIYTALAWRNKAFGSAQEVVRRIDASVRAVYWSEGGSYVAVAADASFYVLAYDREAVEAFAASGQEADEDGIEDAFELQNEVPEKIRTGIWVGDCFIYNNAAWRLNYAVGGEVTTLHHLDKPLYLLGYLASQSRVYLMDKDFNVVSYTLLLSSGRLEVAEQAFVRAKDLGGLLLLRSSRADAAGMGELATLAEEAGRHNIAFICRFLLNDLDACVALLVACGRLPEAAFFARTYCPSKVAEVVKLWQTDLAKINPKAAESLANPTEYPNLFPGIEEALRAEALLAAARARPAPSLRYPEYEGRHLQDVIAQLADLSLANGDHAEPAPAAPAPAPAGAGEVAHQLSGMEELLSPVREPEEDAAGAGGGEELDLGEDEWGAPPAPQQQEPLGGGGDWGAPPPPAAPPQQPAAAAAEEEEEEEDVFVSAAAAAPPPAFAAPAAAAAAPPPPAAAAAPPPPAAGGGGLTAEEEALLAEGLGEDGDDDLALDEGDLADADLADDWGLDEEEESKKD